MYYHSIILNILREKRQKFHRNDKRYIINKYIKSAKKYKEM